jgi:ribosomal protein S18 acetylase RimI-like enzyme
MTRIRRIRADEGASLRDIRLRALRESPSAFSSTLDRELAYGDELWASRASLASAGDKAATFVAESDAQDWLGLVTVLGVDHEAASGTGAAELVSMWIAPEARRLGLGEKLVLAALDFARGSNVPAMELSVTRGNEDAMRLYLRLGFCRTSAASLPADHACSDELRLRIPLKR